MMTDRKASMAGDDKTLTLKKKKKIRKQENEKIIQCKKDKEFAISNYTTRKLRS